MREEHPTLSAFLRLREFCLDTLYTDTVSSIAHQSGLIDYLRLVEASILDRRLQIIPNVQIEANGYVAEFQVDSIREYAYFEAYPEVEGMPVLIELLSDLEELDVFWDVGANIGIYSCFVSLAIPNGQVCAIEPIEQNCTRIRTNLEKNDVQAGVYQCALSDSSGRESFTTDPPSSCGGSGSLKETYQSDSISVHTTTGDDLVTKGNVPSPDVVKIDVEGVEFEVLKGMRKLLSDGKCRVIYCDIYDEIDPRSSDRIYQLLASHGYAIERLWDWPEGEGHYIRATQ